MGSLVRATTPPRAKGALRKGTPVVDRHYPRGAPEGSTTPHTGGGHCARAASPSKTRIPEGASASRARSATGTRGPDPRSSPRTKKAAPGSRTSRFASGRRPKRSHRRATLPPKKWAVPSPKRGLTSVFGMGTGVAPALWTVGKPSRRPPFPLAAPYPLVSGPARPRPTTSMLSMRSDPYGSLISEYLSELERPAHSICCSRAVSRRLEIPDRFWSSLTSD